MLAAAHGDLAQVERLADEGADLGAVDANGASLLYYAGQSSSGSAGILTFVRSRLEAPRFANLLRRRVGSNGHSLALEAVFNANEEMVRALLGLRAEGLNVDLESPTVFGWTPRSFAERERLSFASILPEGSVRPEDRLAWMRAQEDSWFAALSPDAQNLQRRGTALLRAVESLDIAQVEALVPTTYELNARYGRLSATPLNSSVRPGMTADERAAAGRMQNWLIAHGANPNFAEGGIMQVPSGFREAVFGYEELIDGVLHNLPAQDRPAYLNVQGPLNGYTKLMDAALRGRVGVIRTLLAWGAYNSRTSSNPLPEELIASLEP
jgi:ankyrin repeat protein